MRHHSVHACSGSTPRPEHDGEGVCGRVRACGALAGDTRSLVMLPEDQPQRQAVQTAHARARARARTRTSARMHTSARTRARRRTSARARARTTSAHRCVKTLHTNEMLLCSKCGAAYPCNRQDVDECHYHPGEAGHVGIDTRRVARRGFAPPVVRHVPRCVPHARVRPCSGGWGHGLVALQHALQHGTTARQRSAARVSHGVLTGYSRVLTGHSRATREVLTYSRCDRAAT